MNRKTITTVFLFLMATVLFAQKTISRDLRVGLVMQQTQYLYNENGLGLDYTCERLLDKKIHIKATYLSSRLGSAIGTNALKQDYFVFGAHYYFMSKKSLQILAGLNTGLFVVDYENPAFDVLPKSSAILAVETGLQYDFKLPITASLTAGYNVRSGNGIDIPGSLFPVFYKLSIMYRIKDI